MKKFLMTSALVTLMSAGLAVEPQAEEVQAADDSPKQLANTTIVGQISITAPPSRELLQVLEAIQSTKENPDNSIEEWQASFLKNTRRVRDLVETGLISEASFKIDSSSELVAMEQPAE